MKPGNEQGHAERRARLEADPEYSQLMSERRQQLIVARRDGTPEPPSFRRRKDGEVVHSQSTNIEVRLKAAQRASKAAEMKVRRYPWETIAQALGYKSASVARKTVERYINRLPRESMKQLRAQELESLDLAEAALADHIRQGSTQAIDTMLKIKHHRARLMGLYSSPAAVNLDIDLVMIQTTTEVVRLVKSYPEMTVDQVIAEISRSE